MMPMLRLFRHGDGALALFNGMGVSDAGDLATVLAHGAAGAAAVSMRPIRATSASKPTARS